MRVSSKIVNFTLCPPLRSLPRALFGHPSAFHPAQDRVLPLIEQRRFAMEPGLPLSQERFLQREYALRPLEVLQSQAPVYGVQQVYGILARPALARTCHFVLLRALRRNRRAGAGETGVHGGADGVDITPGTKLGAVQVVLRRGESRGVHRRQL